MLKVLSEPSRRHFPVQNTFRRPKFVVTDDGKGIVSHAGAMLLTETARVTGLAGELCRRWAGGGYRGRCMSRARSCWTWRWRWR